MPTIKVSNKLHTAIKQYCVFNDIRIEVFIDEELNKNKKLINFHKKLKVIKV